MHRVASQCLLALALVAPLLVGSSPPAQARDESEPTTRIRGADRVATAIAIAGETFPTGATDALLATAADYPDALSGSGLAGEVTGPVLLTAPDDLDDRVAAALDDLGVDRVYLLGGDGALSEDVERDLDELGYDTPRIAGVDRFDTSALIAERMGPAGIIGGVRTVFVATGFSFADAVAAGPAAYNAQSPVILTTPDDLHPRAADAVRNTAADRAVILGGAAAVSLEVERDLDAMGVTTDRLAGRDRTDTAVAVAEFLTRELGFPSARALVSRGDDYPDALAAGPFGGRFGFPILLTRTPDILSYDQLQWFVDNAERLEEVQALGGTAAVTPAALDRLGEVAAPPEDTVTYSIGTRGDVEADVGFFAEHVDWTLTDQRGWSLGNDLRFTQIADETAAELHVYLASPAFIGGLSGCSAAYSCSVGDNVYINDDNWRFSVENFRAAGVPRDQYRHYLVLHEVGHAPPFDFGHIRCHEWYGDGGANGAPAPVMEQQTIDEDREDRADCSVNVWPLAGELEMARDRALGGASTLGLSPDDAGDDPKAFAP